MGLRQHRAGNWRFLTWLLQIQHPDADRRWRGRNLIMLALGLAGVSLISLPLLGADPPHHHLIWFVLGALLFDLLAIMLARRGHVFTAAWVLTGYTMLGVPVLALLSGEIRFLPFILTLPMLIAGVTLRPRAILLVCSAALLVFAFLLLIAQRIPQPQLSPLDALIVAFLLVGYVMLISALASRNAQYALHEAELARLKVEAEASRLASERATLAQQVQDQTSELRQANRELGRVTELKDGFLASMSHELRTPLHSILGISESLQEEIYGPLSLEQREALAQVEESGRDLLRLINDILDLSKIQAGRVTLDQAPVAVGEICQSAVRIVRPGIEQNRLSMQMEIDPQAVTLVADGRRLKQILVNLLSNAVKFTPPGGQIGLLVRGDTSNQRITFTVWDTGIGIAPAEQQRLFQPFVQLDNSLSRQYEGTGLGLALVAQLTRLHDGQVSVESMPGQGSRFSISLPWQPGTMELE